MKLSNKVALYLTLIAIVSLVLWLGFPNKRWIAPRNVEHIGEDLTQEKVKVLSLGEIYSYTFEVPKKGDWGLTIQDLRTGEDYGSLMTCYLKTISMTSSWSNFEGHELAGTSYNVSYVSKGRSKRKGYLAISDQGDVYINNHFDLLGSLSPETLEAGLLESHYCGNYGIEFYQKSLEKEASISLAEPGLPFDLHLESNLEKSKKYTLTFTALALGDFQLLIFTTQKGKLRNKELSSFRKLKKSKKISVHIQELSIHADQEDSLDSSNEEDVINEEGFIEDDNQNPRPTVAVTLEPNSDSGVDPTPTPCMKIHSPGQLVSADQTCDVVWPMELRYDDPEVPNGYIASSQYQAGLASYKFEIDEGGEYVIYANVKSPKADGSDNSFFVYTSDKGGTTPTYIYDTHSLNGSSSWTGITNMDPVSLRGTNGVPSDPSSWIKPYKFYLDSGERIVNFAGLEPGSRLAHIKLVKVDNPPVIPTSEPTPLPTELPSTPEPTEPSPTPTVTPTPKPTSTPHPDEFCPEDPSPTPSDDGTGGPTSTPTPGPTTEPTGSPEPEDICGDGNIDPGEECDDGNSVNGGPGDFCSYPECKKPKCIAFYQDTSDDIFKTQAEQWIADIQDRCEITEKNILYKEGEKPWIVTYEDGGLRKVGNFSQEYTNLLEGKKSYPPGTFIKVAIFAHSNEDNMTYVINDVSNIYKNNKCCKCDLEHFGCEVFKNFNKAKEELAKKVLYAKTCGLQLNVSITAAINDAFFDITEGKQNFSPITINACGNVTSITLSSCHPVGEICLLDLNPHVYPCLDSKGIPSAQLCESQWWTGTNSANAGEWGTPNPIPFFCSINSHENK